MDEIEELQNRLKNLRAAKDSVSDQLGKEENDDNIRILLKRKKEISFEIDSVLKELEEALKFIAETGGLSC